MKQKHALQITFLYETVEGKYANTVAGVEIPDSAFIHRVRGGFRPARGNAVARVPNAVFPAEPFVEAACAVCFCAENRV